MKINDYYLCPASLQGGHQTCCDQPVSISSSTKPALPSPLQAAPNWPFDTSRDSQITRLLKQQELSGKTQFTVLFLGKSALFKRYNISPNRIKIHCPKQIPHVPLVKDMQYIKVNCIISIHPYSIVHSGPWQKQSSICICYSQAFKIAQKNGKRKAQ